MVYFTFHRMEGNTLLTSAKKEMYVQSVHKGYLGVVNIHCNQYEKVKREKFYKMIVDPLFLDVPFLLILIF